MKKSNWKQVHCLCWHFQLADEPEIIHIVETGFHDCYYVTFEDGYELCNGMQVESYSKQGILEQFGIDLDRFPGTSELTAAELHEMGVLQRRQVDPDHWFTQGEFDRLKYLRSKQLTGIDPHVAD